MMLVGASAWAIDKIDGVYQIGTVEDLEAFAALVNSGEESNANAVLTADINCGDSQKFTIGCHEHRFIGKFDGQGHTVTINSFPDADGNGTLFRNINVGGEVCNVITRGTITTSFKYAAGIASWSRGYIHNCASFIEVKSNIIGDATHAGIVAVPSHGAIVNCFSAMTINGAATENCGGIIGWCDGRTYVRNNLTIAQMSLKANGGSGSITRNPGNVQNNSEAKGHYQQNFFLNEYGNTDIGQKITADQLASGEVCYRLNAGMATPQWFQKEGDAYPMPIMTAADAAYTVGASVAANCMVTDLAEDATFTFGGGQASTQHEMFHGRCKHCGYLPLEDMTFAPSGKGIELKDTEDMMQYSWYRYLCGDEVNAIMAADIDMGDAPYVCNPDNWCDGEFDGQGHTLKINIRDHCLNPDDEKNFQPDDTWNQAEWLKTTVADTSVDPKGFKKQPFNNGGAAPFWDLIEYSTVHDLYITGTIEARGQYAASVTSHLRGDHNGGAPRIYNLYSDVVINSTCSGDCTHGGIIGVLENSNGISNVVFAGTINANGLGSNCGGFVGWTGGVLQISNALMIGELVNINGDTDGNNLIGRNPGNVQITGPVYYSLDRISIQLGIPSGSKEIENADQLTDGSLTFALNNNSSENVAWTQTLGVDKYPIPMASHSIVYAVPSEGFRCDGLPKGDITYTNEKQEVVIPAHAFDNGFCQGCGTADLDYLKPNDNGIYELGTAAQLANFSHLVDKVPGMASASFILTADIDMGEEVSVDDEIFTYSDLFLPIGKSGSSTYWRGTADGQLHPISNLNINYPERRGVGFFGVVGSEDFDHPVVIENFIMDKTCSINGAGYVGLIGFSEQLKADGSNKIIMNNIGVECSAITCTGANAGGVIGCNMGSEAVFEINNCYVTAGLIKGGKESSALTGWFGSHATVKSCWTTSEVQGFDNQEKYFGRFGGAPTLIDCFSLYGNQVAKLNEEDLTSGKLAWDLNGHSFAKPAWFQNLDEGDPYPTVKEYQGHVYCLGGEYYSATDDQTSDAAAAIVLYEETALDELVCQKATIEYMKEQLACFTDAATMSELGTLYDAYDRDSLKKSVDAYADYMAAVVDVQNKLNNEYSTLSGEAVDELKAYLASAEVDVYEAGELDAVQIKAEAAKIYSMLDLAIRTCYGAGEDVTDLLANADFSKNTEGWEWNGVEPTFSRVVNIEEEVCYGAEFWNKYFTMSQTIEGLKPGVYEFSLNAAYRPSDNIYSYNHAAYIFANGIRNYIMTSGEDMLPKDQATNGLNAYLNAFTTDKEYSNTYDFCYFEEPQANVETSDALYESAVGSVTRNPVGMALAAKAGRYVNKVIGVVGEDGVLTVGLSNPGQHTGADGTLFANARLKYLGTVEEADLTEAYASMVDRATSELKDYNMDITDLIALPGIPNYSEELKTALYAAKAEPASVEASKALSKLFADIYDCKQAYKGVYHMGTVLSNISYADFTTIPDGVEPLYTAEEVQAIRTKSNEVLDAYYAGDFTMSTIDALYEELKGMGMPEKDENGVYQAGNAKNLLFLAGISAEFGKTDIAMTSDIDVAGVNFPGFGNEQNGKRYEGTFDGQDHKLTNIYVNYPEQQATGFFNFVGNATIKNVQVDASCQITGASFTGFVGSMDGDHTLYMDRVAAAATVNSNGANGAGLVGCCRGAAKEHITNCFVAGTITSNKEGGAICGWLGDSDQTEVKNCLSIATIVNGDNFLRKGSNVSKLSNNYSLDGGTGANKVTAEVLASGETAYKLNGSSFVNPVWFQNIGTDANPVLFGSSDIVYSAGGQFTNEKPYMGLNAFAYAVSVKSSADQVEVSYKLNADAKDVKIVFKSAGIVVKEVVVTEEDITAGEHTVVIANSEIAEAGTEVTFDVVVTPKKLYDPQFIDTYEKPIWSPQSIAVNNVPSSPGFGQVYVANSEDAAYEGYSGAGYIGDAVSGIYAFNPEFELINEEAYTGGRDVKGKAGNYEYDPHTIRVSEEGRVFFGSTLSQKSPLFEADAADLSAPWTPLFQGDDLDFDATTGIVYKGEEKQTGPVISFDVCGKGDDLKIAALMCNEAFKKVNVNPADTWTSVYNIGSAKAITALPTANLGELDGMFTCTPATVNIYSDNRGGFWFFQYRNSPNETFPGLKHVDADGVIDYSNIPLVIKGGGATVSNDGNTIVFNNNGTIQVYDVDYTKNALGQITLMGRCNIAAQRESVYGETITSMALDFAGNLYTGSASDEKLRRYALPGNDAEKVTPSVSTFKIGSDYTGIENMKQVGPMANGYIFNLSGQRQSKMQRGINIVNGQKILK